MKQGLAIGGLLDACVGVPDLVEAIAYWELYGFRVGDIGSLDAPTARRLYGVDSAARVVRLWHHESDHGLVRLMQWEKPTGEGLGMAPFKVAGSRWSAAEVRQVARVFAHAKYHRDAGHPIEIRHPDSVPAPGTSRHAFRRVIRSAFEMAIVQPLYRQVLFERAEFPSPRYGTIRPGSVFEGSQFTHCCVITCGIPDEAFEFYDRVLGLRRSGDFDLSWSEIGSSGKDIFRLDEGEGFHMFRFDDVRSGDGEDKRSGRLILFNFASESALPDMRESSRPGALGHTLYGWRVRDVEAAARAVEAGGASEVSDIVRNEFGERAFTATAPDGTPWTFVHADDTLPLGD
jgi:catechol 2,3-dioxygenase-like lactoylglutathione lyase family enzyme